MVYCHYVFGAVLILTAFRYTELSSSPENTQRHQGAETHGYWGVSYIYTTYLWGGRKTLGEQEKEMRKRSKTPRESVNISE